MPAAPLPPDEPARLDALTALGVLDTPPEPGLDDLTRLAAHICGVPIALVSLVDRSRQWFKSSVGLPGVCETPRDLAFCAHAVLAPDDLLEVPDATADGRFADNPLVTGPPGIRFYAGMPIRTDGGQPVGTLCVIDTAPRTLTAGQRDALRALARQVADQLRLRTQLAEAGRAHAAERAERERFRAIFDTTFQYTGLLSPDGTLLEANRTSLVSAGVTAGQVIGRPFWECVWWAHNPALQGQLRDAIRRAAAGEFVRFEARHPLADGTTADVDFSVTPIKDAAGAVTLLVPEGRDITALRRAEAAARAEQERFHAFINSGPVMAFMKDAAGRFVYVNDPLCDKFGMPRERWLGRTDAELWDPQVAADLRAVDREVLAAGKPLSMPETVPTPDGASEHWQVTKFPMSDPALGRLLGGVAVDVTAQRRAAESLRLSEERFREVIDRLSDAVVFLDPDTRRVERANPAFLTLLGYTAAEAAGLTQYDFAAHDPADIDACVAEVVRLGRHRFGDRKYRRRDGAVIDVGVDGVLVPAGGRPVLCLVVRDESARLARERAVARYQQELEGANQKLLALATTDRLTGLANRAAFQERLAAECERAGRLARPLSVLMIDVDHFKGLNDRHGHQAGDELLVAVARLLREAVRGVDLAARYGGEEFAVLLPDTDHAGAVVLAERVRRAVAEHPWAGRRVTVSVGASSLGPDVPVPAALVADADAALYRAKRAGRNRAEHGSGAVGMAALAR